MSMPRKPLGNTGLKLSVMGFGGSPLGKIFNPNMDINEGIKAIKEAYKLGINYFDTSPFYGKTLSEKVLGEALKELPREEIIISTKCGRYDQNEFDFSAERIKLSIKESMERLKINYIDMIICHDIEFVDLNQIINEAIPTLLELKKEGIIKHIGFSGYPLKIFKYILDRVENGTVDFILSYCHYNLADDTLLSLISYFKEKGIGIINASVLCMGLLTNNKTYPEWHPASSSLKEKAFKAVDYCKDNNIDLSEMAIKYCIKNEDISSTLIGISDIKTLRLNVKYTLEAFNDDSNDIFDTHINNIKNIFKETNDITWQSGLPENN